LYVRTPHAGQHAQSYVDSSGAQFPNCQDGGNLDLLCGADRHPSSPFALSGSSVMAIDGTSRGLGTLRSGTRSAHQGIGSFTWLRVHPASARQSRISHPRCPPHEASLDCSGLCEEFVRAPLESLKFPAALHQGGVRPDVAPRNACEVIGRPKKYLSSDLQSTCSRFNQTPNKQSRQDFTYLVEQGVSTFLEMRTLITFEGQPGGWDPSVQSGGSMSEQVKKCINLEHCLHWLHLEPTHLYISFLTRRSGFLSKLYA
jgi:hypothetical protein